MTQNYKAFLKDLFWRLYGFRIAHTTNTNMPQNIKSVLFVCKGNVCRSVLAEAIARKIASDQGLTNITFISGGLEVSRKNPAEEHAISVARENGLDITNHYSKPITKEMINQSDAMLGMEYNHLKAIENTFTGIGGNVMLLSLFCNGFRWGYERFNIRDPYARSVDDFRHCYDHIFDSVKGLIEKLKSNNFIS